MINGLRIEADGEDRLGITRWKVTVLHQSPKPSPASPAPTAETTPNQAVSPVGDKNLSPAFARNGKPEGAALQEIKNLSPAPPNNLESRGWLIPAGDAGHSSSHPSKTVSGNLTDLWEDDPKVGDLLWLGYEKGHGSVIDPAQYPEIGKQPNPDMVPVRPANTGKPEWYPKARCRRTA